MSEKRARYIGEFAGFEAPNYTQIPNLFFEMLPDMSDAELRVTLALMRETYGYKRESAKVGIGKIGRLTGLSYNGASAGAQAAEERGTFRRTNPASQKEAEWELVTRETPSASEGVLPQPVRDTPSASEGQVGLKKGKEIKRNNDDDEMSTRLAKLTNLYETNIGPVYGLIVDDIKATAEDMTIPSAWFETAFKRAVGGNHRHWNYVSSVLQNMKKFGVDWKPGQEKNSYGKSNNSASQPKAPPQQPAYTADEIAAIRAHREQYANL